MIYASELIVIKLNKELYKNWEYLMVDNNIDHSNLKKKIIRQLNKRRIRIEQQSIQQQEDQLEIDQIIKLKISGEEIDHPLKSIIKNSKPKVTGGDNSCKNRVRFQEEEDGDASITTDSSMPKDFSTFSSMIQSVKHAYQLPKLKIAEHIESKSQAITGISNSNSNDVAQVRSRLKLFCIDSQPKQLKGMTQSYSKGGSDGSSTSNIQALNYVGDAIINQSPKHLKSLDGKILFNNSDVVSPSTPLQGDSLSLHKPFAMRRSQFCKNTFRTIQQEDSSPEENQQNGFTEKIFSGCKKSLPELKINKNKRISDDQREEGVLFMKNKKLIVSKKQRFENNYSEVKSFITTMKKIRKDDVNQYIEGLKEQQKYLIKPKI